MALICPKCSREHDAYAPCERTATYAAYLKRNHGGLSMAWKGSKLPVISLTGGEARKALENWRQLNPSFAALWGHLFDDHIPHVVHYCAGHMYYHRPENFPLLPRQRSPSDCTWIVPGTERGNSPPPSHVAQPGCPDPDWCSGNNCCYWNCQADPDLP